MKQFYLLLFLSALVVCGCSKELSQNTFTGTVEAKSISIQSEVGGRIEDFLVEEGEAVKAGQVLVRLENQAYQIRLKEAKAALKAAESRLAEARAGSRDQQIVQAAAQVKQLEASLGGLQKNLEHEQGNLEDYRALADNEGLTKKQLEAQANKVDSLVAQMESMEAQKAAAEAQLKLLEQGSTVNTLRQLSALREQAEAAVENANLQLQKTVIKAPATGIIQRKNLEAGELAGSGSSLATLLEPEQQWVTIFVPENKLNLVKLGQGAEISADAYPEKKFRGKISYIADVAEFTPKNLQTKEDRVKMVFAVKVALENTGDDLKSGMPVDVILDGLKEVE